METDVYKITEELKEKGWLYDDTAVYVPYTHKNDEFYDHRNVYLKISRHPNMDWLIYTFVKLEDRLFYAMESHISEALICEEDKELVKTLSQIGRRLQLNAGKGVYIKFVESFKDTITSADCLDVLKVSEFALPDNDDTTNLTIPYIKNSHHNFTDMRELVKLALGEAVYDYPKRGRSMYHCPFHDDHNPSAEVLTSAFRCLAEKIQLDQTGFLMKHFDLDGPQEAEAKFQELKRNS